MNVFRSLPGISQVVVQKNVSYRENLLKYRPDYVIHGDNWKWNEQKVIREEVIQILKEWGGELIEVPYTVNDHVKKVERDLKDQLAMPEFRRRRLREVLKLRPIVRALEVHNGITSLICEKTIVGSEVDGGLDQ